MLAAHESQQQQRFLDHQIAPATLVRAVVDPVVTIGTLLLSAVACDVPFEGAYLILALIVFSLTFPGRLPEATGARALAGEVASSWLMTVAILLFIGWATRTLAIFDQRVMLAWLLATPAARFAAHLVMPPVLLRLFAAERAQRVAVIAGGCELGRALDERIRRNPLLGVRVAGYFDDRGPGRTGDAGPGEILGSLDNLAAYVKSRRVDLIYITLPMASQPRILKLLDELHDTTASIYFTPDIFLFDLIQARMDTIGGMPVVSVCETPFSGLNGLVKRASDVVLASAILLLILPLMLAIAAGVKLSSPGPVLFRQRRYGLDGREIIVYKFRSMTVTEDGGVIPQATRDDRRVTPFGAFLRRYSLDELPQFINVLQGRMSVVGPRPHAVAHNELYRRLIKGYMIRHKVKPGITGWAQVNGLRGETETLDKMKDRIAHDLAYLRNWSLQLDLWIVLKTILVVLRDDKAY
ncbi:MAG TPA: undecaprenyl-phosphate glucose phosphotransferase [Burkholderiales bacterium]|nr:undecaprenyl-phosphate glucose phosphotransferase [Burkholderiales bacterium]